MTIINRANFTYLLILIIFTFIYSCTEDPSAQTLSDDTDSSAADGDTDADTDTDTDTDTDSDSDSDTDSDSDSDSDTDVDTGFEPMDSRLDGITASCGDSMPAPISGGQSGWNSRYWDCCKPHCSWKDNTSIDNLSANCDANDVEISAFEIIKHEYWDEEIQSTSGCDQDGTAFTCFNQAPFAVCENLSYGFAAVPLSGPDACGKCFQLDFDGGFEHGEPKAAHTLMKGKSMIVMASNTGGDVGNGQFDIMIPGGGLGQFKDGCAKQWNVDVYNESIVGSHYGGFSTYCAQQLPGGEDAPVEDIKNCVKNMCDAAFGSAANMQYLHEGCIWYADWMNAANNPTFTYKEVTCPTALVNIYASSF